MALLVSCLGVAVALAECASLSGSEKPAPEGCLWQALPELKAHLAVPNGWVLRELEADDALVFEVQPAGPEFQQPSQSRYRLDVRLRTNPETVVARAREFVEGALHDAAQPQPLEDTTIGVVRLFSTFVEYEPGEGRPRPLGVALSALANTRTGTLYTVRFESPGNERDRVAALGNALFRTVRIDDEI